MTLRNAGGKAGPVPTPPCGTGRHPAVAVVTTFSDPHIHLGCRCIAAGDEGALLPAESPFFQQAVTKVRRQAGAARLVARALLLRRGIAPAAIPKSDSGVPLWPPGIVGSLAHDDTFAVAAVAATDEVEAVGVDIEPDLPLFDGVIEIVATPGERKRYDCAVLQSRVLFALKEAVYKAVFPIDGIFLDFQDVEVDLARQTAEVSYGRRVAVTVGRASHLIALAWVRNASPRIYSMPVGNQV